jgi:predicted ATPase/class 3 adenylate cyclase
MKCPQCQHENREGARFCEECGAKLQLVCSSCGSEAANPEARFCDECGARFVSAETVVPKLEDMRDRLYIPEPLRRQMDTAEQEMEGENRLVTALFADISGFTLMSQQLTPEATVEKVNQCIRVISDSIYRYEGSVNRFIGDCVLAFFGAPLTHENDPERAILAALDMREAVSQLGLDISIGINTGMMYFGTIGDQEHLEISAYGSDVIVAKRLQETAEPGQILVGGGVYRLTRRAFEFRPPSSLTLKGIVKPVSTYEVLKESPRPEKLRGIEGLRAEMIGREREFADLKECMDELLAGRGQIISIMGEAGVGKSRLVAELKRYIEDKDMRWLEGRCVSIGESIGYWVFIDMLRGYVDFSEDDSLEERREKIVEKMKSLFPQRWQEIAPYVGNLLSVRFGEWNDRIRYLPAEQVKHQTFLTLRDVFLSLAQEKPLLLILEDLHWADNLSLDLLTLLMDVLSLAPLMLLCVYRPDKEHKSWHISAQASAKCLDRYTDITLRPLNLQESRRLVQSLLGIENLPEFVRESILQKAEGNPFFVEEVIRSLIESGNVYRDGERWVARGEVEDLAVPDTIQNVIMARIDRLEDEVRYVLQSAAVIGRLFLHKLLQYTTQQEQNLDRYLWQLEERDLVYEDRAVPEVEYSFRHVLTQETAYNTILSRRRREFHRKVAEGYEALYASRVEEYYDELAYHYSRSDDRPKALHYLVKAGDKSRYAFANDEAIEYYHQAIELIDDAKEGSDSAPLGHIYQSLGEIYYRLMRHKEALECCHKAFEYTTDRKQRARIYGTMGFIYVREGERDLALEHVNAGIAELGDDTESPEMARICIPLCWVRLGKGNVEEALETALHWLRILEDTEHYFEMVELYSIPIQIYGLTYGKTGKALEYAQKQVKVAEKSGNSSLIALSTRWHGMVYTWNREDDSAIELLEEALKILRKGGDTFELGQIYSFLYSLYKRKDNQDRAMECLKRAAGMPNHRYYSAYMLTLAHELFRGGAAEEAIQCFEKALDAINPVAVWMPISIFVASYLNTLEEGFAQIGRSQEFIPYCRKIREEREEIFGELELTQWYLEPRELSGLFPETVFMDEFDGPDLRSEWEWVDPGGDSSCSLSKESGWMELRAASGSELRRKIDAPRLLQEISGDFAAEIKTKSASGDLPSVGGILVWKDRENYIPFERLMQSERLEHEIGLYGIVQGEGNLFGRGRLASDIVYLRLERMGDRFSGYCSSDGENWLTCGEVTFPVEDPVQVGVHATGGIGGFGGMDGATRFDYFRVLRGASQIS